MIPVLRDYTVLAYTVDVLKLSEGRHLSCSSAFLQRAHCVIQNTVVLHYESTVGLYIVITVWQRRNTFELQGCHDPCLVNEIVSLFVIYLLCTCCLCGYSGKLEADAVK